MSVAPLFPENPVKMVVPTGVNCKNRERQMHIKTQNIKETIEGSLSRAFYFFFPIAPVYKTRPTFSPPLYSAWKFMSEQIFRHNTLRNYIN